MIVINQLMLINQLMVDGIQLVVGTLRFSLLTPSSLKGRSTPGEASAVGVGWEAGLAHWLGKCFSYIINFINELDWLVQN